jgi:hypothetical protein
MPKPWGHKITVSIYVEGEAPFGVARMAARGAERELTETYKPKIDFIGASIEPVAERPKDQGLRSEPDQGDVEPDDTVQVGRRGSDRTLWARWLPDGEWHRLTDLLPPDPGEQGQ